MKISTSVSHGMSMAHVDAKTSAEMMAKAGFNGVDFGMTEFQAEPEKQLAPEWRQKLVDRADMIKSAGLEIAQCHLPYYYAHLPRLSMDDYEKLMLPGTLRALEVAGEIGCHMAVMHPYYYEDDANATYEANIRFVGKLLPLLEKFDIRLAIENVWAQGYINTNASYPKDIMHIVNVLADEKVGVCLDTGHANIFAIPIGDFVRVCGKKMFALHVNGNSGKADSHTVPYSMSGWCENMDYLDMSAALKEVGYKGYYNLEIASSPKLPASVAQPFYNYAAAVAKALSDLAE